MSKTIVTLKDYETLVEQSPILSWRANTEALCVYFNERWLSFRGRSLEEEYGNGWTEGIHPDDIDRCLKTYLDAFEKRESFEIEYRLKRHDGVYKWIFDQGTPFYTEYGKFAGYIGSCMVVTEKVDVQNELSAKMAEKQKIQKGVMPCSCKNSGNR